MFCGLITGLPGPWWCVFCVRPGPMAVACFTYGWGCWCACLFLGACPVGAWEQWRWRVLRAVVGCSGYGWADNSVGVGVCCVRRFLRTVGGPVAWPVLGTVGGCCGGVLRAVGPEGLLWSACSVGVRLVGWRIFCAQVGAYFRARLGPGGGAFSVYGFGFILFIMRWIIPLCLILTAFFPPFHGACRNLAQKPLI